MLVAISSAITAKESASPAGADMSRTGTIHPRGQGPDPVSTAPVVGEGRGTAVSSNPLWPTASVDFHSAAGFGQTCCILDGRHEIQTSALA